MNESRNLNIKLLKSINFTKVGLLTAALAIAVGMAIDYVSVVMAQTSSRNSLKIVERLLV